MMHHRLTMIALMSLIPLSVLASPPVIENPADPPLVETWNLREVWRLDCEEDESLPLMGVIVQAAVDDQGHVLLLDSQLAQVIEIGPEGEFVQTLGRSGQGPGELEQPNTVFLPDKGTVGMVQAFPGKVVYLNRDGTPAGSWAARGKNPLFFLVKQRGGHLVASGRTMDFGEGGGRSENLRTIARYSREGVQDHVYFESVNVIQRDPPVSDEARSWFPSWAWDQAADGSVLIATRRDEYRLEWYEPGGELRKIVTRIFSSYRRTTKEKKEVADGMRMWGPGGEIEPKKIVLDAEPAIRNVRVMKDGSIWIGSCYSDRGLPDGIQRRYDVFDGEGRFQKEIRIAYEINDDTDYFGATDDGRFICYRGMKSAQDALFADIEGGEENPDEEPVPVQIILLERTP